jgi:PmbA protein
MLLPNYQIRSPEANVRGGEVAFPVKGLTVAGTAEEMFNGIDMLGSNLDLSRATTAPTFRINLLQIGGE